MGTIAETLSFAHKIKKKPKKEEKKKKLAHNTCICTSKIRNHNYI